MSKLYRTCPQCFRRIPPGKHCVCSQAWRSNYSDSAYLNARQEVLERQHGRCCKCGVIIAMKKAGRWVIIAKGAGVHHETPLSNGIVNNDSDFLAGVCSKCHKEEHDKMNR